MVEGNLREIRLDLTVTPFDLNQTLTCGQAFRWKRHDNWWHGVVGETFIKIRQVAAVLQFQAFSANVDYAFIRSYFRLDDDLPYVYSKIEKDVHVKEAVKRFRGLRLMRQDPWECLISYICATNKNIPAIKDMIDKICTRFGKRMIIEEAEVYTFPKPSILAQASLEDLKSCKLGFRAERVKQASKMVYEGLDLQALKTLPYARAKKKLMNLPGVGPKVADCVLLFSLDQLEAFPIDVWMKRVILEYYGTHFEPSFLEETAGKKALSPNAYQILSSFGREYFGEYVGYAQEYLFHFKRCQQC